MLPPPDSSLPEAPRPSRGDAGWVGQGVSQHHAALPLHASTSLHAASGAAWTRLRSPIKPTLRERCDIYAFAWTDVCGSAPGGPPVAREGRDLRKTRTRRASNTA